MKNLKSSALASHIISLSSLEINVRYDAGTCCDYCCVGTKRTEEENGKGEKNGGGAQPVICETRNSGLFWTIFEDMRRDKAKFLRLFQTLEEPHEKTEYLNKKSKKKEVNMRKSLPPRERSALTLG